MLKIKYEGQARIFRLTDPSFSIEDLKLKTINNFSDLPHHFYFIFIDQENDEIQITTTADLHTILELTDNDTKGQRHKIVKLVVKEEKLNETDVRDQSSFEVLEENDDDKEDHPVQDNSFIIEVIGSDEDEIEDLVRVHLKTLEDDCITKVFKEIEENSISCETENYLQEIYKSIQNNHSSNQTSQKQNTMLRYFDLEDVQLLQLVQKSLQKLLPSFIEKLTDSTMATVRGYLRKSMI